jgi:hypothetical protein
MRILKYLEHFSTMSLNITAMQRVWQHHFPEPCGGGRGYCGKNWPTEVVEIATLCEFDEKDRYIYGSHF